MARSEMKIKIVTNGPYLVSGGVPLSEQIITPAGRGYRWQEGRPFSQGQQYALCRCGQSGAHPFCDGAHVQAGFDGEETASRMPFEQRAGVRRGPGADLLDDNRCAFARFCHREDGSAWELIARSNHPRLRDEAVAAATECPAGRLAIRQKDGTLIDAGLAPSIQVVQDPQRGVSAGLYVTGHIPIEGADGVAYETRDRVMLCRCGKSGNKPFCDASHVPARFSDGTD